MAQSRHKAIIAGLALTLTLGSAAPALATFSEESPTTDTDPNGVGAPMPSDYDKADFYEGTESVKTFAKVRSASTLTPLKLSDEMKYFAQFESHGNYDQGLSYGDGYNAMGFYQFDRRYSLMGFIQQVYGYDSTKYAMFKGPLEHASTISSSSYSMYDSDTRQLTGIAQDLDAAWHAAYKADPSEFSALQDAYAYNNYYLPVQSILLNKYGVDVRDRADCVKGLVWGMCNMFGSGGVCNYFNDANLNDNMTDRELVIALCDTVVNRVSYYCSSQPQYWSGWQNRYKKEKEICLTYIAEDEAEQAAAADKDEDKVEGPSTPETPTAPSTPETPTAPSTPEPSAPETSVTPPSNSGSSDSNQNGAGSSTGGSASDQTMSDGALNGATGGGAVQSPSNGSNGSHQTDQADQGADLNDANAGAAGGSAADNGDTVQRPSKAPSKKPSADTGDQGEKADDASAGASAGATGGKASQDDLPQTGDIAGIVLTGASGLAVAGGSFLSLGKKERKERGEE